ncbi:hypothetical protein RhiirA5_427465 [Rhizophagus irregularis]|uniref:Uncharacterized protein n=1 Tax=Rhizophagus irregularis TaxID=588596 RepID=A0A2N0NQI1_9GLOM|nr:hypothetical protein RhiirA5_434189 [Rhizophagus irregularis]PKC00956.1 hypothetical protein RhiirA5_427465 [Rhizophagus irregularis]
MDVVQIKQKVVQIDVLSVIFKADATPFTPKGKEINNSSRPNLSSPNMNKKKKKVAFILKTSPINTSHKTSKKQPASILALKQLKYTTVTMSVNLNEMVIDLWNDGDWKWYYTPNLKQKRNCYQKVKQDDDSEVSQKNTNTFKSDKKHKKTKQAKKIDKSLDSIDKFMVLADIRSMLRKLEVS